MLQAGIIFLIGAVIGSFHNVCIYRLPRRKSVVWPGSHCPQCDTAIPILCNIPILSYAFLRGRCRACHATIPVRYPLVELLTGGLLLLLWAHYGLSQSFLFYATFILFLVPISFIDMDFKLILNVLTFPGIVVGLLLALILDNVSFSQSLLGLVLGGGFLWVLGILGEFLFKKESMGAGDVKLAAMVGVFLGPQVIIALFAAFFIAFPVIAVGLGTKKLKLNSAVPFGPFISLGAIAIVYFGQTLYQYYFNLIGS